MYAALFALLVGPHAAAVRTAPRVNRAAIEESVRPTDISDLKGAVYGLVTDESVDVLYPSIDSHRDPLLFVDDGGTSRALLCLSVHRAQGGYTARFRTRAPAGAGVLGVPFDSAPEARAMVAETRPKSLEMAVRASESVHGACSNTTPLLPTSWSGSPTPASYRLMVGGSGLGNAAIRVAGGAIVDCPTVSRLVGKPGMGAGTYSYACPIGAPLPSCGRIATATVLWFRGSRLAASTDVRMRLPCRAWGLAPPLR